MLENKVDVFFLYIVFILYCPFSECHGFLKKTFTFNLSTFCCFKLHLLLPDKVTNFESFSYFWRYILYYYFFIITNRQVASVVCVNLAVRLFLLSLLCVYSCALYTFERNDWLIDWLISLWRLKVLCNVALGYSVSLVIHWQI